MWLRLRQIALVAARLEPVETAITEVFGVRVAYRDPGVGHFGLHNALLPFGNQFLEVVAPIRADTAGGRYLERRGGDGGYMVITQCDDHLPRRARIAELGVRVVGQFETATFRNMQLHPRDTGGSFLEIDEQLGPGADDADGPWEPAGPDWRRAVCTDRVLGFSAAEIQVDNPPAVAARWSEITGIDLIVEGGVATLPLDNAGLRFVPCADGRPAGLGGIDVQASDAGAILAVAEARGARTGERQVYLCGTRFNLV